MLPYVVVTWYNGYCVLYVMFSGLLLLAVNLSRCVSKSCKTLPHVTRACIHNYKVKAWSHRTTFHTIKQRASAPDTSSYLGIVAWNSFSAVRTVKFRKCVQTCIMCPGFKTLIKCIFTGVNGIIRHSIIVNRG